MLKKFIYEQKHHQHVCFTPQMHSCERRCSSIQIMTDCDGD